VYHGGTIEGFGRPYQLDTPGNSGMHIDCDVEGNAYSGAVYPNASFSHRTEYSSTTEPAWWYQDAAAGGANIFYRHQNWVGALIEEHYKSFDRVLLSDSTLSMRAAVRAGTSLINGNNPPFVDGVVVQPGALTNPANNWHYMPNGVNRESFGSATFTVYSDGANPQVADKIWNTAVTATTSPGWVCTTGGGSPVWTLMPVL